MSNDQHIPHGPPAFKLAGFCVWVFGREFEAAEDYWDGNWLRVLAHCGAQGAEVRVSGPILHLSEIRRWLDKLLPLQKTLKGSAELSCLEPYLRGKLSIKGGRSTFMLGITPDHLTQRHKFKFEVDQSHLCAFIADLERVLVEYPLRGRRAGN